MQAVRRELCRRKRPATQDRLVEGRKEIISKKRWQAGCFNGLLDGLGTIAIWNTAGQVALVGCEERVSERYAGWT